MTAIGARGYPEAMSKSRWWSEAGVLLLPALALGGVALWKGNPLTSRAQAEAEREEAVRLVIQKVKRAPATPDDVAQGMDTRFEMAIGYSGARPASWGKKMFWSLNNPQLLQKQGEKWAAWRDVDQAQDFVWRVPQFDKATQTYKALLLFHLSDAPPSPGEVRFGASLANWYTLRDGSLEPTPDMRASFSVLKAGERRLRPQNALFHSPLKLARIALVPPPAGTDPTTDLFLVARLKLRLVSPGSSPQQNIAVKDSRLRVIEGSRPVERPSSAIGQHLRSSSITTQTGSGTQSTGRGHADLEDKHAYLEDEKGRRYRPAARSCNISYSLTDGHGDATLRWRFSRHQLPQARRLTFHTRVSWDESWPVQIRAVLWDETRPVAKS